MALRYHVPKYPSRVKNIFTCYKLSCLIIILHIKGGGDLNIQNVIKTLDPKHMAMLAVLVCTGAHGVYCFRKTNKTYLGKLLLLCGAAVGLAVAAGGKLICKNIRKLPSPNLTAFLVAVESLIYIADSVFGSQRKEMEYESVGGAFSVFFLGSVAGYTGLSSLFK